MSRYGGGREENTESKVYVGDLPRDADEKDLERAFGHYGPLKSVWVARNPPGFAFLEFEDARDAEDAVRGLDGTNICGARARVEHATGKKRPKPWQRDGGGGGDRSGGGSSRYGGGGGPPARRGGGGGNFDPSDRCYGCGERGHYSYDCPKNSRGGGGGRRRSPSRSRSRSREPARRRSYSRSPSRNRDRSRDRSPRRSVSRD